MVCRIGKEQIKEIALLFKGWNDTMIWSCLEGEMGTIYVVESLKSAMLEIADFCFFGGEADKSLLYHKKGEYERIFKILVPQTAEWGKAIERVYGTHVTACRRYSFKKHAEGFSRDKLQSIVEGLDSKYILTDINREIFYKASVLPWSCDWTSQFHGYEDYRARGIGTAVMYGGELVAGASSYTVFSKGVETQIDTREDFRNQGLAKVCGAAFILRCLERGIYPSWDADNEISAHLACSLGYEMDGVYTVYKTMLI